MKSKKFLTPYTYGKEISALAATINNEPSLTQQSDLAESDINILMARYNSGGQLPQVIEPGQYGDFTEITDYRDAQNAILAANEAFAEVPAKIREKFENDPAKFFEFVNNPENLPELRKLGLANPEEPPEYIPTPSIQAEEEYNDDGSRTRANRSNAPEQHARNPRDNARTGEEPLRQREELRQNGDRGARSGDPSRKGS